jgi:hypothetical protein
VRPEARPAWLARYLETGEEPKAGTDEAFELWLFKADQHPDYRLADYARAAEPSA